VELFEVLPPRSAIVSGDFITDRMLRTSGAVAVCPAPRSDRARDGARCGRPASQVQVVAFAGVERLR
jgi:hypothetical protein